MSVYCIVNQSVRLSIPTGKTTLRTPLAYDNSQAHAMRVTVFDEDGEPADLTGIGAVGSFLKSNNETVTPIYGTLAGNVVQVILPASCYNTPGRFKFTMNLWEPTPTTGIDAFSTNTAYAKGDLVVYNGVVYRFTAAHSAGAWTGTDATLDGSARTILWVEGIVETNISGTIIDPGTPVGNITSAIAQATSAASAASEATVAANAAAASAVGNFAGNFSASTAYTAGQYVIYADDGKLYRLTADHVAGTTWANTSKVQVTVGVELVTQRQNEQADIANLLSDFAGFFDAATVYTAGQYVTYSDAKLYRLTGDHTSGTAWADTAKVQVTLGSEIDTLNRGHISSRAADATRIQGTTDSHADLDNYTVPGTYTVIYTSDLAYIDNAPVTGTTFRLIVMQTTGSNRTVQIALINDTGSGQKFALRNLVSSGWKPWQYMADAADVAALDKIIDSKNTYNLLNVDDLITINSYVNNTTNTLLHSTANVKTLVLPVTSGKTYTFSRKNAGSRLVLGCGAGLWTDDDDHALLNTVYATSHPTYGTITVPEGGNYLYVFFYRAASDSNYDATIEEAVVAEGTEVREFAPYIALDVERYMLSDSVVSDIAKGVSAYNASTAALNRWATRTMTFGVEFDLTANSPAGTRIADASGKSASDFDNIFPWSDMRRCNVTITGGKKAITYDGDTGFATDGSNGDVFVEIPAFYVCREKIGSTERWLISGTEKGGFELHPWFRNEDGTKAEFRYYGAYKASVSSGAVKSVSGALPYNHTSENFEAFMTTLSGTGYKRNDVYALSAVQFLFTIEHATRNGQSVFNGSTYNPYFGTSSPTYDLEAIVSITNNQIKLAKGSQMSGNSFAYYAAGMQVYIGTSTSDGYVRNVTAVTTDSDYIYITVDGATITLTEGLRCAGCAQRTGKTDGLTTASGYADEDSHVAAFRYRYIENPWGTIWEVLDGLKAQNNAWYITTPSHYRESAFTNWEALGYTYQVPASAPNTTDHSSDNWIQEMGFDTDHRAIALPEKLFSDSGTTVDISTDAGVLVRSDVVVRGQKYYCDAFYNNGNSVVTVPVIGGGWDHHENAGLFCTRMLLATTTSWLYGERLTC